jgi:hypothetical protein
MKSRLVKSPFFLDAEVSGFGTYVMIPASSQVSGPVDGAVLSGPRETIETRVREAGSKATVRTVVPSC